MLLSTSIHHLLLQKEADLNIENKRRFNGVTLYIYSGEINKTTSILIVTTGNVEIIKEYDKYRIPDDFQPNVLFGGRGL